jgi:hypothetical protein
VLDGIDKYTERMRIQMTYNMKKLIKPIRERTRNKSKICRGKGRQELIMRLDSHSGVTEELTTNQKSN